MTRPNDSASIPVAPASAAAETTMIVPEGWGFVETVDRRDFLKLTSSGLLVIFAVTPPKGMPRPVWNPAGVQRPPADFNAFLHIGADGRVTVLLGKIEMGQGAMTSLPQLAAEELNVPLASVDVVMGDTDLCPFDMGTFGSMSVRNLGPVLRAAAAEARAVLVQMAAEKLQVSAADLEVKDGVVTAKATPAKRVSYGELTAGKRIERRFEGRAALEKVSEFTVVGKSAPRRDALEKVTGKAKYAGDIMPPDALHARILRAPAHGATLTSVDTSAAEKAPGVRVVKDGDLVAVLHAHRDEADAALKLVKAIWAPSPSTLDNQNIFAHLEKAAPEGRAVASGGNVPGGGGGGVGGERRGRREGRGAGGRAEVSQGLRRALGDGDTFGGRIAGGRRQGHRVGEHADALPAADIAGARAQAPDGEGARDHAVRGRRVRREERQLAGDRGRAARGGGGQARARGV